MMAALSCVNGTSHIHETVFENRMLHARELQKMGAQITIDGDRATIQGVDELYGEHVIATDIRAGAALVLAGLVASGRTTVTGIHHVVRGYDRLDVKLAQLGADIEIAHLQ
jgi:UDP-N-acetylglucosamine 1-carboxyvinyltransferase